MLNDLIRKLSCLLVLAVTAGLWLPQPAHANTTFANQTGATCDTCHSAGIDPNKTTLNATGSKYLNCHYNAACAGIGNGAVKPAVSTAPAAPAPVTPPAPVTTPASMTTKDFPGIASFSNNCGSQPRWIVFRTPGGGDHGVAVKIETSPLTTIVEKGATFASYCGNPAGNGQFNYINLDAALRQ